MRFVYCLHFQYFRLLKIQFHVVLRARARTSEQRVIVSIAYYFIIICVALNGSYLLVAKLLDDAV